MNETNYVSEINGYKIKDSTARETLSELQITVNTLESNVDTLESNVDTLENSIEYSTDETVIGKWIDKKPLYRKVITLSALPNNDTQGYASGITNMKQLINMYGMVQGVGSGTGNDNVSKPINFAPHLADSQYIFAVYNLNTNMIRITTASDLSYLSGYAILEYTKTTD